MSKFKVGDRVRRVRDITDWAPLGFEATVLNHGCYMDRHGASTMLVDSQWELATPVSPVRTITRKEIVPGPYSGFHVGANDQGRVHVVQGSKEMYSPSELRAAAATFIELADALDEVA